jgi:uridine kinase
VNQLYNGETIPYRKYQFATSKGIDDPKRTLTLPNDSFLVLEGIHGFNPLLLQMLGEDRVTPIYIAPLKPIAIDYNHRLPGPDLRLIRRIVRDHKHRGRSARQTLLFWTSVRIEEERNIFPFHQNAEIFFNSTLVYEIPALLVYAKVLLSEATDPDPGEDITPDNAEQITKDVTRLLAFLNCFYPIPPEIVPNNSCIREFIGGSELKY